MVANIITEERRERGAGRRGVKTGEWNEKRTEHLLPRYYQHESNEKTAPLLDEYARVFMYIDIGEITRNFEHGENIRVWNFEDFYAPGVCQCVG